MHENHRLYLKVVPLTIAGFALVAAVCSALGMGTGAWVLVVAPVPIAVLSLVMGGSDTPPIVPWTWWRSLSWRKRSAAVCGLMWFVLTRDDFGTETGAVYAWMAQLPFGEVGTSLVGRGLVFGLVLFTAGLTLLVGLHALHWLLEANEALAEKRAREGE